MGRPIDARNLRLLIMETNFFICNGYWEYTSPISPQLDIITRLVAKAATRAVMIPIFLEPIPGVGATIQMSWYWSQYQCWNWYQYWNGLQRISSQIQFRYFRKQILNYHYTVHTDRKLSNLSIFRSFNIKHSRIGTSFGTSTRSGADSSMVLDLPG